VESQIKIFYEIISNNNKFGSFQIGDFKFFYKILKIEDYKRELKGYENVKKFYDVEKLLLNISNNKTGILIYEYDDEINENKGLLVDYYAENDKISNIFYNIINQYKAIFKKTLKFTVTDSCDIFYKNRINSRLKKYYDLSFYNKYDGFKIVFNNKIRKINLKNSINEIEKYFEKNEKKYWTIVSQCDPTDLNITINGKIIDYLGGGENPVMAELAMFLWQNICIGNYLAIKYNSRYFEKHNKIKSKIDNVDFNEKNNTLFHYIREIRLESIKVYIIKIIIPLLQEIKYDEWYIDLKNFIALKILTIFNLNFMEKKDILLSLCYFDIFYSNYLEKPEELLNLINNIYEKIQYSN
jgi:hypothetical protein